MAITIREWARIWALAVAMHCTAPVSAEQGGNTVCVVCVVVVALVEQMSEVHNSTVDKEVEKLCDLFPAGTVRTACDGLVLEYGPEVIRLLGEQAPLVGRTDLGVSQSPKEAHFGLRPQ